MVYNPGKLKIVLIKKIGSAPSGQGPLHGRSEHRVRGRNRQLALPAFFGERSNGGCTLWESNVAMELTT